MRCSEVEGRGSKTKVFSEEENTGGRNNNKVPHRRDDNITDSNVNIVHQSQL